MVSVSIRQVSLLKDIDPAIINRCLSDNSVYIHRCAKGVTVHQQHEPCTALDVVLSGRLIAYALAENGSAMDMFTFEKGSMIGANLLFGDQNAYPLNIYATAASTLLRIDRAAVTDLLHDHRFTMRYIKSLSMNSQGMNRKIVMLAQKTLRENLLEYLRQQSQLQGSLTVALPISKKQLADYLGVQRPSLFRELKKLKDEGILAVDNRRITLFDV